MTHLDKEDLRVQYRQSVENYRAYDRHVWQVPSITILVASGIVGASFGYLENALIPSSILLLFGIVLTFAMFIAVRKHRYFQYHTIERIREIEKKLSLDPLPLVTGQDVSMTPNNWVERQSAGNWLAFTVLFAFICLVGLLIYNIVRGH